MAIRPVDLQLAYLAAPNNAAVLSNAQNAPQAAQQAAASAFAAEVTRREEQIDEPDKVHGTKVREREPGQDSGNQPQHRRRQAPYEDSADADALGLGGDGEHLIDVTA